MQAESETLTSFAAEKFSTSLPAEFAQLSHPWELVAFQLSGRNILEHKGVVMPRLLQG